MSFERPSYTVDEDGGPVEVCFETSTGHPDRDIEVQIQVQDGVSASCGNAPEATSQFVALSNKFLLENPK